MNSKRFFAFLTIIGFVLFGMWLPVGAAPSRQQEIPTPTPGEDGRIIYIVQAGDNCFRVAALNGITVEQLRQLNPKLDEACSLVEGQELLIGAVALPTATAQAQATSGIPTVTPTPLSGLTEVCVLLYDDKNGDAQRQEDEPVVADGAVDVTEINGKYSASLKTVASSGASYPGICFTNVPEGIYNVSAAFPDNYNPTIDLNYSLKVNAGDRAFVSFSAQSKDVVAGDAPKAEENQPSGGSGGASIGLALFGAVLLLGGAGLGFYAWQSGKPSSKLGKR
ncbi:MAG: LysM peptidoglycan-binding domain-containing protein [Anaerolineales bacterium]|nr:LysM peptidoglycan-binding domain-containing protein [Anaerolineales bacterium]